MMMLDSKTQALAEQQARWEQQQQGQGALVGLTGRAIGAYTDDNQKAQERKTMTEQPNLAPLYEALAKAQAEFPPIVRSKTVRVTTDNGGSYTFDYAPLESILDSCRPVLNKHGLSITQPFSDEGLTTRLCHKDGAHIEARLTLKTSKTKKDGTEVPLTIQEMGSQLTYLRRYSVQCLLGVNAEDDDDGNQAAGNQAQQVEKAKPNPTPPRGKAEKPKSTQPVEGASAPSHASSGGDGVPGVAIPARSGDIPCSSTTRASISGRLKALMADLWTDLEKAERVKNKEAQAEAWCKEATGASSANLTEEQGLVFLEWLSKREPGT